MLALDSISRFLDSSATLGMTSFNKFRMSGKELAAIRRDDNRYDYPNLYPRPARSSPTTRRTRVKASSTSAAVMWRCVTIRRD